MHKPDVFYRATVRTHSGKMVNLWGLKFGFQKGGLKARILHNALVGGHGKSKILVIKKFKSGDDWYADQYGYESGSPTEVREYIVKRLNR